MYAETRDRASDLPLLLQEAAPPGPSSCCSTTSTTQMRSLGHLPASQREHQQPSGFKVWRVWATLPRRRRRCSSSLALGAVGVLLLLLSMVRPAAGGALPRMLLHRFRALIDRRKTPPDLPPKIEVGGLMAQQQQSKRHLIDQPAVLSCVQAPGVPPPHLLHVLVSDLGWGWWSSPGQMDTPFLDGLLRADHGAVRLTNFITDPVGREAGRPAFPNTPGWC